MTHYPIRPLNVTIVADRRAWRFGALYAAGIALLYVVLVMALMALSAPAQAQGNPTRCNTHAEWVKLLEGFSEEPVAVALLGTGNIIEVWVSPDRGTWTILQIAPNGLACAMVGGTDWIGRIIPLMGDPV